MKKHSAPLSLLPIPVLEQFCSKDLWHTLVSSVWFLSLGVYTPAVVTDMPTDSYRLVDMTVLTKFNIPNVEHLICGIKVPLYTRFGY